MTFQTPTPEGKADPEPMFASKVLGALSFALDLTEGQPMGHSMQSCLIGMRIAEAICLPIAAQCDLYYALLLKDAGCSSNASKLYHILQADEIKAKGDLKDKDWTKNSVESFRYALDHVAVGKPFLERVSRLIRVAAKQQTESRDLVSIRCERGASIARRIGFSMQVAEAIASLDEHWNGGGYPMGLSGDEIPILSRIMNLSQTLAVFWTIGGSNAAVEVMDQRARRWFDPELVKAVRPLALQNSLFSGLDDDDIVATVASLEPQDRQRQLTEQGVDDICAAFAEVIDTKSPFTFCHSRGVARAAVATARQLGFSESSIVDIRRASLLHDIGKLAIPNSILEKPGKLDDAEWNIVRKHPYYTLEILKRIPGFEDLSQTAAAHHERLDGRGYFRNWGSEQLSTEARIIAVSDVYDALAAARPYREALPRETVFSIMEKEAPHSLDIECLRALQSAPESDLNVDGAFEMPSTKPEAQEHLPALAPQFA